MNLYLSNYYLLSKRHQLSFGFGAGYTSQQEYMNLKAPSSIDIALQLRKRIKSWPFSAYYHISTCLYDNEWTTKGKRIYETDQLLKATYRWGESTRYGIRISYNFGNTQVKELRERKTSNSNVRDRVN